MPSDHISSYIASPIVMVPVVLERITGYEYDEGGMGCEFGGKVTGNTGSDGSSCRGGS